MPWPSYIARVLALVPLRNIPIESFCYSNGSAHYSGKAASPH